MKKKSAISRKFLDEMYRRLHQAKKGMENASNKDQRESWDSLVCCISCSIDDYLAAHAPVVATDETTTS